MDMVDNKEIIALDAQGMKRAITRIAHEIADRHPTYDNLVLIGIRTRGVTLANRLAEKLNSILNFKIPLGYLDITMYRDDIDSRKPAATVKKTDISFSLSGKNVIIVDDVLYTGRTVRAALQALVDFGRPRLVELAVLIDRGLRELPIQPNYVGRELSTTHQQRVMVRLVENDGADEVIIRSKKP